MIQFRCWFCNRIYFKSAEQVGQRFRCSCRQRVRVPRRSGGSSKSLPLGEWLMEMLVYGGLCAVFAFVLSFTTLGRVPFLRRDYTPILFVTLLGLLAGAFLGERALNYLGQRLRDRENE